MEFVDIQVIDMDIITLTNINRRKDIVLQQTDFHSSNLNAAKFIKSKNENFLSCKNISNIKFLKA